MRRRLTLTVAQLALCIGLSVLRCFGGDAPRVDAPTPALTSLVTDEEKWVFNPVLGRPDVFVDYQIYLQLEKQIQTPVEGPGTGTTGTVATTNEDPLEYARQSIQRIEVFMGQRKWEDAVKVADQAIKKLSTMSGSNAEVNKYLQVIKGYQDQASDALLRDEAEAAFDGLGLKVEGILWSESGPRLALISGEARALGVNDRVKDCVIINIDTDRVDFRFHFKRKRFEFPRYVGEDSRNK